MLSDVGILPGPSERWLECGVHAAVPSRRFVHPLNRTRKGDMSCDLIVMRHHSLELEGGNLTREAGDDTGHLPWPQGLSCRPVGTAFCVTIVLTETSD